LGYTCRVLSIFKIFNFKQINTLTSNLIQINPVQHISASKAWSKNDPLVNF